MVTSERGSKRVVVWGTGFVGKMVIAEIVKHPLFELVGVGVSNPDKVGRDVGDICGLPEWVGIIATDDVDALIALKPDALVHYGPTAMHAKENIALITRFLRAGIDVCSTAMTPWVWPTMHLNPPNWIAPITEACELGESSCFTTGIDPGFANDLFPMTLMGLCSEVRSVGVTHFSQVVVISSSMMPAACAIIGTVAPHAKINTSRFSSIGLNSGSRPMPISTS